MTPVWDNSSLEALFVTPEPVVPPTSPTNQPIPTNLPNSPIPPASPIKSEVSVGPIVGGTIGGVALLVAIGALIRFMVIRHTKKKEPLPISYETIQKFNPSELGTEQTHEIATNEDVKSVFRPGHQNRPVELDGGQGIDAGRH